jgi:hypothetical protein
MVRGQWNHKVHTFPPQRADEPLAEGIGPGTLRWRFEDAQAQVTDMLVKLRGENAVPIMKEETVAMMRRDGFAQLLERPWGRGMCRHIAVEYAARGMFHQDKDVEHAKGGRDHDTEVTRDDRLRMITYKGAPVLRGRVVASTMVHALGHVFAHRARRHAQPQLQQQFIRNAFLPPCRILTGHTANECLKVCRNRWASRSRFPAPEEPKAPAMPAEQSSWLYNDEGLAPVEPSAEPRQGKTGSIGRTLGFDLTLLIQRKLFTQEEIFRSKRCGWTQAQLQEAHGISQ